MSEIFQIPSTISKITTMGNKSLRLNIDTQESISAEAMSKLMAVFDQMGHFTFSVEAIVAEDIIDLPKLELPKGKKTPSQELRERIWTMGMKNGHYESDDKKTAEEFYKKQMTKLIDFVNSKIDY